MKIKHTCGHVLDVADKHAGKKVRCPNCGGAFHVPASAPKSSKRSGGTSSKSGLKRRSGASQERRKSRGARRARPRGSSSRSVVGRVVPAILVLALIGGLGYAAWHVWSQKPSGPETATKASALAAATQHYQHLADGKWKAAYPRAYFQALRLVSVSQDAYAAAMGAAAPAERDSNVTVGSVESIVKNVAEIRVTAGGESQTRRWLFLREKKRWIAPPSPAVLGLVPAAIRNELETRDPFTSALLVLEGDPVYGEKDIKIKVRNVGAAQSVWIRVIFDLRDAEGNALGSSSEEAGKPVRQSGLEPGDAFEFTWGLKEGETPDPGQSVISLRYK